MAEDTLEFWHPSTDAKIPDDYFAWGTVAPGSSQDRPFRIRNVSYSYTALDVTVSLEHMDRYEPARPEDKQHVLTLNGRQFAATASVGTLPPRVISDLVTLRRVTARDADEGPGEFQLAATANWE